MQPPVDNKLEMARIVIWIYWQRLWRKLTVRRTVYPNPLKFPWWRDPPPWYAVKKISRYNSFVLCPVAQAWYVDYHPQPHINTWSGGLVVWFSLRENPKSFCERSRVQSPARPVYKILILSSFFFPLFFPQTFKWLGGYRGATASPGHRFWWTPYRIKAGRLLISGYRCF
jgi:hypothetical protein